MFSCCSEPGSWSFVPFFFSLEKKTIYAEIVESKHSWVGILVCLEESVVTKLRRSVCMFAKNRDVLAIWQVLIYSSVLQII